jgi:hypothetical protein
LRREFIMSNINDFLQLLDGEITSSLNETKLEEMLKSKIDDFLNQIKSSELKNTYRNLSRKLHPDHIELKAFKGKSYSHIPQQVLNALWEEKNSPWTTKLYNKLYNNLDTVRIKIVILERFLIDFSNLIHVHYKAYEKAESEGAPKDDLKFLSKIHEVEIRGLFEKLKSNFSELYYYENYPKPIQNIIFTFQTILNIGIAAALVVDFIILILNSLLNDFVSSLLKSEKKNLEENSSDSEESYEEPKSLFELYYEFATQLLNDIDTTQPIYNYILKGLSLIISLPLVLVSYSIDTAHTILAYSLMSIKLLSAELINAPLRAYNYFSATAQKNNTPKAPILAIM